jgi:hypothetical protein
MMIGGAIIGLANALISYYPVKYLIIHLRRRQGKLPPPEHD